MAHRARRRRVRAEQRRGEPRRAAPRAHGVGPARRQRSSGPDQAAAAGAADHAARRGAPASGGRLRAPRMARPRLRPRLLRPAAAGLAPRRRAPTATPSPPHRRRSRPPRRQAAPPAPLRPRPKRRHAAAADRSAAVARLPRPRSRRRRDHERGGRLRRPASVTTTEETDAARRLQALQRKYAGSSAAVAPIDPQGRGERQDASTASASDRCRRTTPPTSAPR